MNCRNSIYLNSVVTGSMLKPYSPIKEEPTEGVIEGKYLSSY